MSRITHSQLQNWSKILLLEVPRADLDMRTLILIHNAKDLLHRSSLPFSCLHELLFLPYLTEVHSGLYDISPVSRRAYKISWLFTRGKFENISRLLPISFTTLLLSLSAISSEAEISLQSQKLSSTENFIRNVEQTLCRSHACLTSCSYILLKTTPILPGMNDKQHPIYLF